MDASIQNLAETIWKYHELRTQVVQADLILVLSSNDIRVAAHAVEVWRQFPAPMVFSGGIAHQGDLLDPGWNEPEARVLARHAVSLGLPPDAFLLEETACNTGENFSRTEALLREKGQDFASVILVQKPFMLRRAYATGKKHWPERILMTSAQQVGFAEYLAGSDIPPEQIIHILLGDLQRIRVYGACGFQIPMDIPDPVWESYEKLVGLGFDKHLLPA